MTSPTLPITIAPNDPRFLPYTAMVKGDSHNANVRDQPSLSGKVIDVLHFGVTESIQHLPVEKLTDTEKVFTHDTAYRWYVVKLAGYVGYVREDAVDLKPVPTPPPVEPPAPPVIAPKPPLETNAPLFSGDVSIPAAELRAAMALLSANRDAWIAMAADFRQRAELLDAKVKDSNTLLDSWNTRLRDAA